MLDTSSVDTSRTRSAPHRSSHSCEVGVGGRGRGEEKTREVSLGCREGSNCQDGLFAAVFHLRKSEQKRQGVGKMATQHTAHTQKHSQHLHTQAPA